MQRSLNFRFLIWSAKVRGINEITKGIGKDFSGK
jgi:hypothetical protein